ncbi:MAG TPA: thioesterase family protein [Chloroflexia bacterium]|nr:thioesterase family protein [Chloroflexia bacterium]
MFKHVCEFRVEWGETDTAGIIFYPNYYRWFDRATHELFRAAGMPIRDLSTHHHFGQPIIDSGCRFLAPLYYDDLVTLETVVTEVRSRTFRLEHTVKRGETVTGTGFEVRAWIALHQQSEDNRLVPVAIPEEYAARLRGEFIV